MKINKIPLLHSYNNTACKSFWDGFFNYSGRRWVVMHSKDKEIQAMEIQDPRAHSHKALKIFLLFTVIVPIIAAISLFIRTCHFRKYHVTLITPQKKPIPQMDSKLRQIREEEATLTLLPEKSFTIRAPTEDIATLIVPKDNQIVPLNAPLNALEAYEYITKQEAAIKLVDLKLIQNLEKIPFKQIKGIRNLNAFISKNFPKLKEMEVSYEDITGDTFFTLIECKKTLTLTFIGTTFRNNASIENIIRNQGDDLISLLKDSPRALLHLIFKSLQSLPQTGTRFKAQLFKAILIEDHLSKFNAEELGDLFTSYGKYLNDQNRREYRRNLNLLEILPPLNLFPYIFKADKNPERLLQLLIENHPEYTLEQIQEVLRKYPPFLKSMFEKPFVDNLKALVFHKDVKEETRLRFFLKYSVESVPAEWLLEFVSDEGNLKQFQKNCLEEWSNSIFNFGLWQFLKKERRAYLLLVRCLNSLKEKKEDFISAILKAKPLEFMNAEAHPLILAMDALRSLDLNRDFTTEVEESDYLKWAEELSLITPLEKLDRVLKMFLNKFRDQGSLATITSAFVSCVLDHREEKAIKKVMNEVLPNFYNYFHFQFQAVKDLLNAFDSSAKLESALDCIVDFPTLKKDALLDLFSVGYFAYVHKPMVNTEMKLQISLPPEKIKEMMDKRGLRMSPNQKLYPKEILLLR